MKLTTLGSTTDVQQLVHDQKPALGHAPSMDDQQLTRGHHQLQDWFASPNSYGDFRDVTQVAGFQSHGIRKRHGKNWQLPASSDDVRDVFRSWASFDDVGDDARQWRLTKLQLVGLLYEDEPVVYELETLPEVASHDTAPKRPLDKFEAVAMRRLCDGENIHTRVRGRTMRMPTPRPCHWRAWADSIHVGDRSATIHWRIVRRSLTFVGPSRRYLEA